MHIDLADRILMKLGLSATDLLDEAELQQALRRKMSRWDAELAKQSPAAGEDDFDFDGLPMLKIPPGRSRHRASDEGETAAIQAK